MLPKNSFSSGTTTQQQSAWILLAFVWTLSLIALSSPLADELIWKAVFLAVPLACSFLALLANPTTGFAIWGIGITLLVTQTGFQLDIGPFRTSALEVLLIVLLIVLLFIQRTLPPIDNVRLPGQRFFLAFVIYAIIMALIAYILGTSLSNILAQFKGFLLYPLVALVLLVGLRSQSILRLAVGLLVIWYIFIAFNGVWQFVQGTATVQFEANPDLFRANGDYAPTNVFGITLGAVSILCAGIALRASQRRIQIIFLIAAMWLLFGAMTSISRTVAVAFVVGYITLALASGSRRIFIITLAVSIPLILLFTFPPAAVDRLLQITDSSSIKRIYYLQSGWRAWLASLPFGHGWGRAFWLTPGNTLIPSASFPWYHNDYLNLAVQTGLLGLLLYLAFWWSVLRTGFQQLATGDGSSLSGYTLGSLAALIFFLTAALFEHALWRPDIAGLLGWMLGIMLVSMQLQRKAKADV